ncbi:MAG: DUF4416 family protein, partial [Deltaproteobacteria bacterium]|nr:DUF4416 family protein [Deltaproteobacteria bacterium]
MSQAKPPPPMKYFLAAFGPDPGALDSAAGKLSEALAGSGEGPSLGSPDFISADLPLTETGYYEREMGPNLVKRYMTFPDLAGPELLPLLKLASRRIEDEFSASGHRTVNLDPGYVFEGGLVLSTFKFSGHRLYLGRGVWGELTLHFHRGRFEPLPWT